MRNSILAVCLGLGIVVTPIEIALGVPAIVQQIDRATEAMIRRDYATAIALLQQAKQVISRRNTEPADLENAVLIDNFLSLSYQEVGDLAKAQTAIASAIKLEQELNSDLVARVYNTQANLKLKQGNPQAAALNFRAAKELYRENQDTEGEVGAAVNEAIALQKLGQYRTAQKILEKIELKLATMPDSLQAAGYKALGTTYATIGNFSTAREKLEASIALTQDTDSEATAKTKIDLAAAIGFSEPETAIELLHSAVSSSQNREIKAIARLNSIDIYIEAQDWLKAREIALNSQDLIFELPHNDYAKIDLIRKMALIKSHLGSSVPQDRSWLSFQLLTRKSDLINLEHKQILKQIAQSAQSEGIVRTESYAVGTLAYLEEQQGNLTEAIALNLYALDLTNQIEAEDIAYQWQWQLGRIYKEQAKTTRAIAYYQQAVENLGQIRQDLVAFNPESQYSFRESVEPVYRQLVELLISQPTQENLIQARNTIESLQMAELENYFRSSCLEAQPEQIDNIDPLAATIYPIITSEKLAVLTSIPGQPIELHTQDIAADEIESKVKDLWGQFNPAASNKRRKAQSQEFYSWLVEPSINNLKAAKIETLVFILDSGLRNLPVSALYDGQQYLVENYALALTPGLQLLPSQTESNNIKAVVAGLSQANQGFVALPGVNTEVQEIADSIDSKVLLNEEFTNERLRQTLKATAQTPILHLATHGQFSSKAEETFILTWNDRIDVNQLEQLLKVREETPKLIPIELLVLSACKTAQGDDKAVLGLAGIALKSGARSTLGTLWSVSDESTVLLIDRVYEQIASSNHNEAVSSKNKAQILRQAQLELIRSEQFNHPYYWAAFVLVGNWI